MDVRQHEDLLRTTFRDYDLDITRRPTHWEVILSTPALPDEPQPKKIKTSPASPDTAAPATPGENSHLDQDDFNDLFSSSCSFI